MKVLSLFDGMSCGQIRVYRGVEIKQYLDEHPEIENHVILDDDSDMLLSQKDHFIKTDSESGISEKNVKRAIEILNNVKE